MSRERESAPATSSSNGDDRAPERQDDRSSDASSSSNSNASSNGNGSDGGRRDRERKAGDGPIGGLFVGKINQRMRRDVLEDTFRKFGSLTRCDIRQSFAFFTYADMRDAEDAYNKLNGAEVEGGRLYIEWTKESGRANENRPRNADVCFECGKSGHFGRNCPTRGGDGRRPSPRRDRGPPRGRSPPRRRSRSRSPPRGHYNRDRSPPRRYDDRDRYERKRSPPRGGGGGGNDNYSGSAPRNYDRAPPPYDDRRGAPAPRNYDEPRRYDDRR